MLPWTVAAVQCFVGYHLRFAVLGAVMLTLCGLVIPVVLGLALWLNRSKLSEPLFALKVRAISRLQPQDLVLPLP